MALIDRVNERVPAQRLINLTRAYQRTGAGSSDADILGHACDDAEAAFRTYTSEVYDESNGRHVWLCVRGAVLVLQDWVDGNEHSAQALERWKGECERYEEQGPRARLLPVTDVNFTPQSDSDGRTFSDGYIQDAYRLGPPDAHVRYASDRRGDALEPG